MNRTTLPRALWHGSTLAYGPVPIRTESNGKPSQSARKKSIINKILHKAFPIQDLWRRWVGAQANGRPNRRAKLLAHAGRRADTCGMVKMAMVRTCNCAKVRHPAWHGLPDHATNLAPDDQKKRNRTRYRTRELKRHRQKEPRRCCKRHRRRASCSMASAREAIPCRTNPLLPQRSVRSQQTRAES